MQGWQISMHKDHLIRTGHDAVRDAIYAETIQLHACLLYTSDAADERSSVDLGGRRIIKKKTTKKKKKKKK